MNGARQRLFKSRIMVTVLAVAMINLLGVFDQPRADSSAKVHLVEIENLVFSPASLEIQPGDRVRWINRDFIPHTATASDKSWSTGTLATDESAEIEIRQSMVLTYFCVFHPGMTAAMQIE